MSHEIRTPINAIVGFSQLLDAEEDRAERLHFTRRINENSERLLFLIENILDFTRIQGGRVKLAAEEFNPASEMESLLDTFRNRVDPQKVALSSQLGEDLDRTVTGDPERIRQILSNLLENAIKFTPSGTIEIRGRLLPAPPDDWRLEVEVADTGVGIPSDKLTTIFKPFEQVDCGLRRKFEGSGLGLAICQRLSDLMGGTLTVESELGKGSTFRLCLPLRQSEPEESPLLPGNHSTPEPPPTPRLPGDFLIVEDDPNNAEVLQKILQQADALSIRTAANKASAEEALRQSTFSVILMDIHLGSASGLDLIRELRAGRYEPTTPRGTPVVVVTAFAPAEIERECTESQVDGLIHKPYSATNLAERLAPFVTGRDSR
jgi:CheY-like chemotaxis protein/anti-sigma regulatory factor (Ser/Thr protein kinase)